MYIEGYQTVRGTDAQVVVDIEGKRINLFQVKNFDSNANIALDEVPRIGTRTVGHKVSTITYEGSFTAYHGSPFAREEFLKYVASGRWPNISITTYVKDKDTGIGQLTVIHKNVHFSTVPLAKIDAESTSMEEDFDFTCDQVEIPEDYAHIQGAILPDGTEFNLDEALGYGE